MENEEIALAFFRCPLSVIRVLNLTMARITDNG
jgi:hypothetical protein